MAAETRVTPRPPRPRARLAALALLGGLAAGCGEAVFVLGELPCVMRLALGTPPDGPPAGGRPAHAFALVQPRVPVVGDGEMIYVAETRGRILALTPGGQVEVLLAPPVCHGLPCPERVEALAWDSAAGALLFTDSRNHRVYRLPLGTRALEIIAGTGQNAAAPDGALAAASPLAAPAGIVVGENGTIYVAESGAHRVRSILPDGTLGTVAGTGLPGFDGDGDSALRARFLGPYCLARHGSTLMVCDNGNLRIRAVDLSTGTVRTVAGSGISGFEGDGGDARQARFRFPSALAITRDGRTLFIADPQNRRVRSVHLGSHRISTYAGNGQVEYRGNGRVPGDTPLDDPTGVAVTGLNLLYIVDRGQQLVWRVSLGL
jgi:sugar lactone lactonase YvrE